MQRMIMACRVIAIYALALIRRFKPQVKGALGELMENVLLTRWLDKNTNEIVPDLMLSTDDATTQIDHVARSRYASN